MTNFHVIRDADEVKVATADGREFESKLLLKDESIDLAVLKIEAPEPFPAVAIGDSDALQVGDLVLAIGNPFGVGQTTTSGIVSALARSHIGVSDFGFFIQTDAAINPGNSGGALVNMAGELVGINTAIYSRSGGSIGIGFAIPSNIVRAVVAAARNGRDTFERPFVGATFEPVTAAIAESLGMPRPEGALIAAIIPDGPAAKAGLKAGDVVLCHERRADRACRRARLPAGHPDDRRHGEALGAFGRQREDRSGSRLCGLRRGRRPPSLPSTAASPFAGTKVAALSPRLAQRMRLPADTTGVAIAAIARNSPAAELGLRPRDIVREVNGVEIDLGRGAQGCRSGADALVALHGRARGEAAPPGAALLMADLFSSDKPERKPPAGRPLADRLRPGQPRRGRRPGAPDRRRTAR